MAVINIRLLLNRAYYHPISGITLIFVKIFHNFNYSTNIPEIDQQ